MVTQRQLPTKTLHYINNLNLAIARQDPPWHRGFATFYSMVTQRQLPAKTLHYIGTLTLAMVCQYPPWHGGVFNVFLHGHTKAVACQDPPYLDTLTLAFARHDPPWHGGFFNFLFHDHTNYRVQFSLISIVLQSDWGLFSFPRTKHSTKYVIVRPDPGMNTMRCRPHCKFSWVEYANAENLIYHPSRTLFWPVLPSRTVHV